MSVVPFLYQEYIVPGKVRLQFRHFPLQAESSLVALASECANEQGAFWPYHDYIFAKQGTGRDAFTKANLKSYASALGLDGAAFGACLDSGRYKDRVAQDRAEGEARGVKVTPTLFIGEQRVEGVVPMPQLRAAIESALGGVLSP